MSNTQTRLVRQLNASPFFLKPKERNVEEIGRYADQLAGSETQEDPRNFVLKEHFPEELFVQVLPKTNRQARFRGRLEQFHMMEQNDAQAAEKADDV